MDMKTIGVILMIVAFASLIYVEVKKRTTFAKLEHYMAEQDFDSYLAVLDQPIMNVLYPEYNRLFMRLNAYLATGDEENTARVLDAMAPLRMNKEQKLAFALRAFTFYVEVEDKPKAAEMLAVLEEYAEKDVARMSRETYEIFLCGSHAYIDEMKRAVPKAPAPEQARLYQLLAMQYENCGDSVHAEEYHERAKRAFEEALG